MWPLQYKLLPDFDGNSPKFKYVLQVLLWEHFSLFPSSPLHLLASAAVYHFLLLAYSKF